MQGGAFTKSLTSSLLKTKMAVVSAADCKAVATTSHCRLVTLAVAHFVYLLIGAVVFQAIEAPGEEEAVQSLRRLRSGFRNRTTNCTSDAELEAFIAAIIDANNRGVSAVRNATLDPNWGFGAAFFFATSVVTTIGYGHVAPLSEAGKAFCVIYALFGLPLTLVMLTAITQRLLLLTNALLVAMLRRMEHIVSTMTVYLSHLFIIIIAVVILAFLIPSAVFMWLEPGWDYLDAIYYCFISLTTIGLGDYVPGEAPDQKERGLYKVIVSLYLFFGLVLMMLVLSTFGQIPELNIGSYFYIHPDHDEDYDSLHDWPAESKRARTASRASHDDGTVSQACSVNSDTARY